jgi:hypothetical protein
LAGLVRRHRGGRDRLPSCAQVAALSAYRRHFGWRGCWGSPCPS